MQMIPGQHQHPQMLQQQQQGHAHPHHHAVTPVQAVPSAVIDAITQVFAVEVMGKDNRVSLPEGSEDGTPEVIDALRAINALAKDLRILAPSHDSIPPPPMVTMNQRSIQANKFKTDGNQMFQKGNYNEAVRLYTLSLDYASTRPLYENSVYARDELSTVLCNRAAAYIALDEHVNGLVDADAVIKIKRNWTKGHFRKSRALMGLGRLREAREALLLGLEFEPSNVELIGELATIDTAIELKSANKPIPQLSKSSKKVL